MKNFAWKEGSGISDIYPGALVFDGVDDYGTCDNFPITVILKIMYNLCVVLLTK